MAENKSIFFEKAGNFLSCRVQLLKFWKSCSGDLVSKINDIDKVTLDERFDERFRQKNISGSPVQNLQELYDVAESSNLAFKAIIESKVLK